MNRALVAKCHHSMPDPSLSTQAIRRKTVNAECSITSLKLLYYVIKRGYRGAHEIIHEDIRNEINL